MAWLDDRIQTHPKIVGLSDRAHRAWINTLCYSSMYGTRGNVDVAISVHRVPKAIVRELVRAGLWEEHEDGVWVHDWGAYNEKRDEQVAKRRAFDTRRQQLMRNPELRAAVRERDGDHCRYCGREVNWLDRKSIAGATYDHIDPHGPNTLENLVVCCRSCTSIKRGRTLEEAGLRLLPIKLESNSGSKSRSKSQSRSESNADLDPSRARAQARAHTHAGARPNDHDHDQGSRQEQQQVLPKALALHDAPTPKNGETGNPAAAAKPSNQPPTDTEVEQAIRSLPGHDHDSLDQILPLTTELPTTLFHDALERTRTRVATGNIRNAVGLFVDLLRTANTEHRQRIAADQRTANEARTPADDVAEQARSYARGKHPWPVAEELLTHRIQRIADNADQAALLELAHAAYDDELAQ